LDEAANQAPMTRMIARLEADDDPDVVALALAAKLPGAWSRFAEKPVATYALRKISSAGQLFMMKLRLATG
jgi:hypothetical protein